MVKGLIHVPMENVASRWRGHDEAKLVSAVFQYTEDEKELLTDTGSLVVETEKPTIEQLVAFLERFYPYCVQCTHKGFLNPSTDTSYRKHSGAPTFVVYDKPYFENPSDAKAAVKALKGQEVYVRLNNDVVLPACGLAETAEDEDRMKETGRIVATYEGFIMEFAGHSPCRGNRVYLLSYDPSRAFKILKRRINTEHRSPRKKKQPTIKINMSFWWSVMNRAGDKIEKVKVFERIKGWHQPIFFNATKGSLKQTASTHTLNLMAFGERLGVKYNGTFFRQFKEYAPALNKLYNTGERDDARFALKMARALRMKLKKKSKKKAKVSSAGACPCTKTA